MQKQPLFNVLRSELHRTGNPVIIDDRIYFCWEGKTPPSIICDLNGWDEKSAWQFERLDQGFWIYPLSLPQSSYIEYAFIRQNRRISDPHNPHRTPNGMGKHNHYFTYPSSELEAFSLKEPSSLKGKMTALLLPTHRLLAGRKRVVYFYQPAVEYPVPLLVMWDGKEYLERTHLPHLIEELAEARKIHPVALALIENGRRYRTMEYLCSEATVRFLQISVIPVALDQLNVISPQAKSGSWAIGGASLGGLMALYTALRMPDWFGKVLSQSGAFSINGQKIVVWSLIEHLQALPLNIWLDCGIYEPLIETNRQMADLLRRNEYSFTYVESNSGHNYPAWRHLLPQALTTLFGK